MKFLQLSKFILLPIFNVWIELGHFCCFDTAMCNSTNRDIFLNLLSYPGFKFFTIAGLHQLKFLKWVASRRLQISTLHVYSQTLRHLNSFPDISRIVDLRIDKFLLKYKTKLLYLLGVCLDIAAFHLESAESLHDDIIHKLASSVGKKLTRLVIKCSHLGTVSRFSNDSIIFLSQMSNSLRVVVLENMFTLTDVGLATLMVNCSAIEELTLNHIWDITYLSMVSLSRHCPKLLKLEVNNCRKLQVSKLFPCIQNKTYLRHVNFQSNDFSPDDVLESVACFSSLIVMESLSFSHTVLSNRSMIAIVANCALLTTFQVNFGYYDQLTYATVQYFAENCPRSLTVLTWAGCRFLDSLHVTVIVSRCGLNLRQLNISACKRLNFEVMFAFGSFSKNLGSLDMNSLENEVTSNQLDALFHGCCNLFWLNISCDKSQNCRWYRLPMFSFKSCVSLEDLIVKGFVVPRELLQEFQKVKTIKLWR
jgi:hypothetical protein